MNMIIKNVKLAQLNTNIETAFLNTKTLKINFKILKCCIKNYKKTVS